MIKAVLLDVGGTILKEEGYYSTLFEFEKKALRESAISFTDKEFEDAVKKCIFSFVPDLHKALTWFFTKPDIEKCNNIVNNVRQAIKERITQQTWKMQDGAVEVIKLLSKSYKLALAGNTSGSVRGILDKYGVLKFFANTEVSGDIGLSKPDIRFFEYILRKTGARANEAVMVGDRLDNDVIPAKLLGMKTILLRIGIYSILEPRIPEEIPDAIIDNIKELPLIIAKLL